MKITVIDAKTIALTFPSKYFVEDVFIRDVSAASIPYVAIDQDGSEVQIPAPKLRKFAAALTDFADKIGAP